MTRDPLLPVRLVDGVWTTEGAGSAAVPTERQPGIMALGFITLVMFTVPMIAVLAVALGVCL